MICIPFSVRHILRRCIGVCMLVLCMLPSTFVFAQAQQQMPSLLPGVDEQKLNVSVQPAFLGKLTETGEFGKDSDGNITIANCAQLRNLKLKTGPLLYGKYLATKIRCGQMQTGDIPYYIKHVLEFLVGLAGTVAVIMVMVGGYQYAIGGITENKEQGKKTITAALIGLMVALVAWVVINAVQALLTTPTSYESSSAPNSATTQQEAVSTPKE